MKVCPMLKVLVLASFALVPAITQAQTTVALPSTSQTTTISAIVSEQAIITLPSSITFNVANVRTSTATTAAISVTNIVTATAAKQLRISVQANAASFTPPIGGAATWSAGDVSWNAGAWTNATGSAGTLSSSAYTAVALGTANVNSLSVASLPLTLTPNSNVTIAGSHTLVVTWKIESI